MREQNRLKNDPVYKGIYSTWVNMRRRCLTKTHPKYPRYGGRGITIFEGWAKASDFLKWSISSGWEEGKTLDRINNDGNYCPENCRWVSVSENSRKKSTTKITIEQAADIRARISGGEDLYDIAKKHGVCHGTIWFIKNNITHVEEGECSKRLKEIKAKKKK